MLKFNKNNYILLIICVIGFACRLLYLLVGAKYFNSTNIYLFGDSFSYSQGFINFYNTGIYTFDFSHQDAYFGRLPIYSFFWGGHYLIFGEAYVYQAVAFSQILLDTFSIYLIYSIVNKLTSNTKTALFAAVIYAFYFFIIIWLPITATESFATFLTVLFFYFLIQYKPSYKYDLFLSILVAICFYTREYLGILIIPLIIQIYFKNTELNSKLKHIFISGFVFIILYSIWPIRNYVNYGRIIFIKTPTSGYHNYSLDIVKTREWLSLWTPDANVYLEKIYNSNEKVEFPIEVFKNYEEKLFAESLIDRMRGCSSGVYYWKNYKKMPDNTFNCDNEVAEQFSKLILDYKSRNSIQSQLYVPFQNLKKSFFKSELTKKTENRMFKILFSVVFSYRSIFVILGFLSILFYKRKYHILPMYFFVSFMYLFISAFVRQVEMRYLIQADVILLILAFVGLSSFPCNNKLKDKTIEY
jgi:Gpi18-like mannosyltransferase